MGSGIFISLNLFEFMENRRTVPKMTQLEKRQPRRPEKLWKGPRWWRSFGIKWWRQSDESGKRQNERNDTNGSLLNSGNVTREFYSAYCRRPMPTKSGPDFSEGSSADSRPTTQARP